MTQQDRDNFFSLMVFYDKLTTWKDNRESKITDKDRIKLKIITDTIIAMLVQLKKREGDVMFDTLMKDSSKYQFAIIKKDENLDLSGTFEPDIVKGVIERILRNNSIDCVICDRTDYKNCDWFTLKNFVGECKCNDGKGCPYKNQF